MSSSQSTCSSRADSLPARTGLFRHATAAIVASAHQSVSFPSSWVRVPSLSIPRTFSCLITRAGASSSRNQEPSTHPTTQATEHNSRHLPSTEDMTVRHGFSVFTVGFLTRRVFRGGRRIGLGGMMGGGRLGRCPARAALGRLVVVLKVGLLGLRGLGSRSVGVSSIAGWAWRRRQVVEVDNR